MPNFYEVEAEQLKQKTIAQQKAKRETYDVLKENELPIPWDLRNEIEYETEKDSCSCNKADGSDPQDPIRVVMTPERYLNLFKALQDNQKALGKDVFTFEQILASTNNETSDLLLVTKLGGPILVPTEDQVYMIVTPEEAHRWFELLPDTRALLKEEIASE